MSFGFPFAPRHPHFSHNITDSFDRPIPGFSAISSLISSILSSVISGLLFVSIFTVFDVNPVSPAFGKNIFEIFFARFFLFFCCALFSFPSLEYASCLWGYLNSHVLQAAKGGRMITSEYIQDFSLF
jgi:hypothetical protein